MAELVRKSQKQVHQPPENVRHLVFKDQRLEQKRATEFSSGSQLQEKQIAYDQAFRALQFTFVAAPILAGLDKFFGMMTTWEQYLSPIFTNTFAISAPNFMRGVGVIEIIAGIGVALKPHIFAYVVSAWMAAIIANLLLTGNYYDIALRDFGLCLGAFALGRIASTYRQSQMERA